MRSKGLVFVLLVTVWLTSGQVLFGADWAYPFKENSLTGVVKTTRGEPLEGIVIRAKKQGSHIGYAVASDAQGKYRFPKLEAGRYAVEIARAEGLEPERKTADIQVNKEAQVDFFLGPAKEMARQMTAVDWLLNLPGTQQEKALVGGCVTCHFVTPMRFTFDRDGWLKIVRVMRGQYGGLNYQNWGIPVHEQEQGAKPTIESPGWEEQNRVLAEYLAKVRGPQPLDLSNAKILPRPKGPSTRVIYTEYDIPYDSAEPHDLGVAGDGTVFWTDWRHGKIGKLDPKTGEMKHWTVPPLEGKQAFHPGTFQVTFDKDDNPWTTVVWDGGLVKLDRKTEKLTTWTFPDKGHRRAIMTTSDKKRNRIWFQTDDYYGNFDLAYYEPDKNKLTVYDIPFKPGAKQSFIYGHVVDSKGNAYALKARDSDIDRIDVETEKLTRYSTPTPNSFPRRGDYDAQDRIWFAQYNADQIGMLDPATGKITEYKLPIPMAKPYSVNVDRRTGLGWAAEFLADRFAALDPKTGEMREYLLPARDSQVRIIDSYSVGDHSVIWYGAMGKYDGGGKVVKLEAWW